MQTNYIVALDDASNNQKYYENEKPNKTIN